MSGRLTGNEYFRVIQDFVDSGRQLPTVDTRTISVTRLSDATGIPTQSMYKNPKIRELIDLEAGRQGLLPLGGAIGPDPDTSPEQNAPIRTAPSVSQRLERHAQKLEQQNASLMAENSEYRQKLKSFVLQFGREDMTIETGRRVADPRQFK